MQGNVLKRYVTIVLLLILTITVLPLTAFAASSTTCDGKITVTSNLGTVSTATNGTVTVTHSISGFSLGTNYTFTITNSGSAPATVQFDYSGTSFDEFSLSSKSGTYPATKLLAGASITITAKSQCYNGQSDTLTLSNFVYTEEAIPSVTINYDSSAGSVTVDGATASSDTAVSIGNDLSATLSATPATGKTFLAWADANGNLLSTASSYTVAPTQNTTYKALFGDASVVNYMVGQAVSHTTTDAYQSLDKDVGDDKDTEYTYYTVTPKSLYTDFQTAISATNSTTHNVIVPLNSGSIPAGNYTISAGVTLLIPFDDENTMYTTVPGFIYSDNKGIETNYCKLTLSSGTNLTVNGAISISTTAHSADGGETCGNPVGNYSMLAMGAGSTVTINNGGALYAWGFVTGDGTITAKSGATVYENFQLTDYRGGRQSSSMQKSVFAASQYYVQNVEVPMTLEAGAVEYGATWVNLLSSSYRDTLTLVPFIASDGLFELSSGSLTKTYDGTTDRLIVDFSGTATINSVALNIGQGLTSVATIDSASYVLGINNNITMKVNSGNVTVGQNIAFQPGSALYIAEDATATLGSGVNAYVYDGAQWGNFCYSGSSDLMLVPVPYAPSRTYSRTASDLVDADILVNGTLDASAGGLYTTEGKANIHSTGKGIIKMNACADTNTYQFSQASSTYTTYPVTSAELKNNDGKYISTNQNTFTYDGTNWRCATHTGVDTDHTCDVCGDVTECADSDGDSLCDICGANLCDHSMTHTEAKDPTCTEAGNSEYWSCGTCKKFFSDAEGKTEIEENSWVIEKLDHKPTATAAKAATCKVAGNSAYWYCETCKTYFSDEACTTATTLEAVTLAIDENAHTWDNDCDTTCNNGCGETREAGHNYESKVTDATCTTGGSTTHTCSVCGDTYTDSATAATGHNAVTDEAVAATCTTAGKTAGSHCGTCGETITAQTETPALGHDYEGVVTTQPTCTENGVKTFTCKNDASHTYTEEVDALGHTEVIDEAVDATCTKTGLTEGKHCSVCGEVIAAQTVVAAKGHTEVTDAAVDATCTESGLTEGKHCDLCNEVLVAQTVVDALGHTEVVDAAVAATCTETGLTEGKHCSVCNEVLVAQEVVPVLDHTEVTDAAVAATCTATGLTEGKHCSVCNEVIVAQETVAALGHTEVTDAAVAATCTATGLTEGKHCSVCNEVLVAQNEVPALGHKEVTDAAVAATCTTAGKTEGKHCSVCNEVLVAQKAVPAGHTIEQGTAQKKTCTQDGWEAYEYCTECDYTTKEVIPAGHSIAQGAAQEKTCTQDGWAAYEYCTECDYTTKVVIPAGHTLTQVEAKAATCTEAGYDAYEYCSACDYTTYKEAAATGHSYVDGTCSVCGEVDPDATTFAPTVNDGSTTTEVEKETAADGTVTSKFKAGTGNSAPTVTVTSPAGGWKANQENTFTVESTEEDIACIVIVKDADGNYEKRTATTVDGVHSFTTTDKFGSGCEVIVAIKGDADGNGIVGTSDYIAIARSMLQTSNAKYSALNELSEIVGDADGNGTIGTSDYIAIARSLLQSSNAKYQAIAW